jgi:hypothetical protein
LGTGVKLAGANGYVQTVNDDYSVFLGPVSRASLSSNPLALHAWDDTSSTSTFWFDIAGDFSLGNGGILYDIGTDVTTFTGEIDASDITGSTITGSTIQTSATGKRVIIDEGFNALYAYVDGTTSNPFVELQAQEDSDGVLFISTGSSYTDAGTAFNDGITAVKIQAGSASGNASPVIAYSAGRQGFSGNGDWYGFRVAPGLGDTGDLAYGIYSKFGDHSASNATSYGGYFEGEYGVYGKANDDDYNGPNESWAGYFDGDTEIINGALILTSPNSTRYAVTVNNSGTLVTTTA